MAFQAIGSAVLWTVGASSVASVAVVGTTVGAIIGGMVVTVGLNYLSAAIANAEKSASTSSQTLQSSGVLPRSFVVGKFTTAGKLVYANTWGKVDDTPNAYLTLVIALQDVSGAQLTGIWAADKKVTYNGTYVDATLNASNLITDINYTTPTSNYLGYDIPEYITGKYHTMYVKYYDGTQTVADSFLANQFSNDPNYPYSSTRVGKGVAYVIITMMHAPAMYPSIPQFKFELSGIPLYDQRLDSTAGGTGTQRFNDKTTWTTTNNPVVIINNILRGITDDQGKWLFGLQSLNVARVPSTSWFTAADACDLEVDNNAGGTEPQYRVGMEITVDQQPVDVINELLKSCNGRLAEIGGNYKIAVGVVGSSVASISDDDLYSTEQQVYVPFPEQQSVINGMTAKYPEPTQNYNSVDAPPRYNPTFETIDGGRFVTNVNYSNVPYLEQTERLMSSAILESRKFRIHTLVLPPEFWMLEPNDILTYTSGRNGYVSKLFRVNGVTDSANLDITITIQECDPSDYNWTPATDFIPKTDGVITLGVVPPAQAILTWAVTNVTITGADDHAKAAIKITWNTDLDSPDDIDAVIIQIRLKSDQSAVGEYTVRNWTNGSTIISENILSNTIYEVRGQYSSKTNRDMTWSSWLTVTTDNVLFGATDLYDNAVTRAKLDEALQNLNDFLGSSFNDLMDEIQKVSQAGAEIGLGASDDIKTIRQSLVSVTGETKADYENLITAATGPNSAIVSDITSLQTIVGAGLSSTLTEAISTNTTNINTNANSITTLSSTIGGSYSPSSTVATAITTNANAITLKADASSLTALTATFDNIFATVKARFTASSAPSGAAARIAFSVSATDGGSAESAAMYLDALSGGGSRIMLVADQVNILSGTDSAALSTAFIFSGGTMFVNKAVIPTITSDQLDVGIINASTLIADNIIVTNHLVGSAVTATKYGQNISSTAIGTSPGTDITSVSFTSTGGDVVIQFSGWWLLSGTASTYVVYEIRIDGGQAYLLQSGPGATNSSNPFAGVYIASADTQKLSVGTHTITLHATAIGTGTCTSRTGTLLIIELKK